MELARGGFVWVGQRLNRREPMNIVIIQPVIALVAGIVILIAPKILNYVIAVYLILIGLIGLFPKLMH